MGVYKMLEINCHILLESTCRLQKSNRLIFHAILYWLNTGIPWLDLPERFGPWQTVYSRFRAWTLAGVWDEVLSA